MKSLLFLLLGAVAMAESPWTTLPAEDCRNGEHVLALLKPVADKAKSLTLKLTDMNGNARGMATRVAPNLAVAKFSDLPKAIFFDKPEGLSHPLRIVKRWERWDLCVLEIQKEDQTEYKAPVESPLSKAPGQAAWVISGSGAKQGVQLGNISAKAREIPASPAALGILMGDNKKKLKGVFVREVSKLGPAGAAGIRTGDVIVTFDGEPVTARQELAEGIFSHAAGDTVSVGFLRKGKPEETVVTLSNQRMVLRDFEDESGYRTTVSARLDGFPMAIQHDTSLAAEEMGGPVFDLEGRIVGVNIARQDRVTTYCVPWHLIQRLLAKLPSPHALPPG